MRRENLCFVAAFVAALGCAPAAAPEASAVDTSPVVASAPGDVTVTWSDMKQKISGFGAAAVFWAQNISAADADFFFSASRGLGLSLVRVSVNQEGKCPEIETAKKAVYYGARVWAASWTPPAAWKSNMAANAMPKAYLLESHYADFAKLLGDYAESLAAEGVPLYALSPQNEPDWEAEWDGCLWSPAQFTTFIRDHLGPTFTTRNLKTQIMAPDTASWKNMDSYVTALMADSKAKGYVNIIATHPYNVSGSQLNYTKPQDNGKEFWETEVSQEKFPEDTPDPSITSALTMVSMIQDHLLISQMNGWHWWALIGPEMLDDPPRKNPALVQNGVRYKRAYALGNFAKFIRPGWVRLGATEKPATNIRVSAYRDPAMNRLSIVAVNSGTSARMQKFSVPGQQLGTVTPWVTSDTASLEKQTAIANAATSFSYSLPARSIVTFVNWNAEAQGDPAMPPPPTPDGGVPTDGGMGTGGRAGTGGAGGATTGSGGTGAGGRAGSGGAAATGGATGTGGAATGGAIGSGGSSGTGGTTDPTGTGGAEPPTGSGGMTTSGTGGAKSGTGGRRTGNQDGSSSGCGCAFAGGDTSHRSGLVSVTFFGLVVVQVMRRRRRR